MLHRPFRRLQSAAYQRRRHAANGIHYFDLFDYLLGQESTAVTARLRDFLGRGMDDLGFCAVETLKASGPEPLSHELRLFLDAWARGTPPVVDVEAAHRSSKRGRRVLPSELN